MVIKAKTSSGDTTGVVKAISGNVTVTDINGVTRTLHAGDKVSMNDIVDASVGATVHIEFANGNFATLGSGQSLQLTESLFAQMVPAEEGKETSAQDIAAMQALITDGGDPSAQLEASAAGINSSGGGSEEGGSFVVVQQNAARGSVTPGHETGTFEMGAPKSQEYTGIIGSTAQAGDSTAPPPAAPVSYNLSVGGSESTLSEAYLPGGSSASGASMARMAANPLEVDGSFSVKADAGVQKITIDGKDIYSNGQFHAQDIADGSDGILHITGYDAATGIVSYTYELTGADHHHNQQGFDTLDHTFAITVEDAAGKTAGSSIIIHIEDDMPVVSHVDAAGNAADTEISGTISGFSFGADDAAATDAIVLENGGKGAYGTVTLDAHGQYTYTIDPASVKDLQKGQSVTDTITYTVKDADGDTVTETMTFSISGNSFDERIVMYMDKASLTAGSTFTVTGIEQGMQHPAASIDTVSGTQQYGTATINAAGQIVYMMNAATQAELNKSGGSRVDYVEFTDTAGVSHKVQVILTTNADFNTNDANFGHTVDGETHFSFMANAAHHDVSSAGSDVLNYGQLAKGSTIDLGAGKDTITVTGTVAMSDATITGTGDNVGDTYNITGTGTATGAMWGTSAINAGGGADTITVEGASFAMSQKSAINAGDGADTITVKSGYYGMIHDSSVNAGAGDDTINISGTNHGIYESDGFNTRIDLGTGADSVTVTGGTAMHGGTIIGTGDNIGDTYNIIGDTGSSATAMGMSEDATILAGGGNDTINIQATNWGMNHNTVVNLGAGADTITVTGGSAMGGGTIIGTGDNIGDTYIITGNRVSSGNDGVGMQGGATLLAGGGDDSISISGMNFGIRGATVSAGDGNDTVTVTASTPGASNYTVFNSNIDLGAGQDTLTVTGGGGLQNATITGNADAVGDTYTITATAGGAMTGSSVINAGDGADTITLKAGTTGMAHTSAINAGGGDDIVNIIGTTYGIYETAGQNTRIDLGTGNDTLNISGATGMSGGKITDAGGETTLTIHGGNTGVAGSATIDLQGQSTVNIDGAQYGMNKGSLTTHDANDVITVTSGGTGLSGASIRDTGGDNTISVTSTGSAMVGGSITTGAGSDAINITTIGSSAQGAIYGGTINAGEGANTIHVTAAGNAMSGGTLMAGSGDDTYVIKGTGANASGMSSGAQIWDTGGANTVEITGDYRAVSGSIGLGVNVIKNADGSIASVQSSGDTSSNTLHIGVTPDAQGNLKAAGESGVFKSKIYLGEGNDTLVVAGRSGYGMDSTTLTDFGGNNTINVSSASAYGVMTSTLNLGAGNDTYHITSEKNSAMNLSTLTDTGGDNTLDLRGGTNGMAGSTVDLGGTNTVTIDAGVHGMDKSTLITHDGNDVINVTANINVLNANPANAGISYAMYDARIVDTGGDNTINVQSTGSAMVGSSITTGVGNDSISITATQVSLHGAMYGGMVNAGDGDNTISVTGVSRGMTGGVLQAGSGDDTYTVTGTGSSADGIYAGGEIWDSGGTNTVSIQGPRIASEGDTHHNAIGLGVTGGRTADGFFTAQASGDTSSNALHIGAKVDAAGNITALSDSGAKDTFIYTGMGDDTIIIAGKTGVGFGTGDLTDFGGDNTIHIEGGTTAVNWSHISLGTGDDHVTIAANPDGYGLNYSDYADTGGHNTIDVTGHTFHSSFTLGGSNELNITTTADKAMDGGSITLTGDAGDVNNIHIATKGGQYALLGADIISDDTHHSLDNLFLDGDVRGANIHLGGGDDSLLIHGNVSYGYDKSVLDMGAGNDHLTIAGKIGGVSMIGGDGVDTLHMDSVMNNQGGHDFSLSSMNSGSNVLQSFEVLDMKGDHANVLSIDTLLSNLGTLDKQDALSGQLHDNFGLNADKIVRVNGDTGENGVIDSVKMINDWEHVKGSATILADNVSYDVYINKHDTSQALLIEHGMKVEII